MGYLVLARKYRPQTFDEVYAQEQATTILKNAIETDRIAHAYLFTGPRGVGKTSMARIFAKSLNCNEGVSSNPCNKCSNCDEITKGISPDVVEIDGASNTGVDDVRSLQNELMYAPSLSPYKIYIIDEVHMLSKNAFNALLKTLEEPPDKVIFIFATTEPHKVLPTIISRCQRYDFKRIPIKAIVKRLQTICVEEKITIEEEAFYIIARKADGGMRDALSLLDQVLSLGKKEITGEDVLNIFGIVDKDVYNNILNNILQKQPGEILNILHDILEKGYDLQEFFTGLLEWFRNLLLIKLNVKSSEIPESYKKILQDFAKQFTENDIMYLMSFLIKTKIDMRTSGNPMLMAEMAFIKLAKKEEISSLEKILEQLSSGDFVTTSQAPAAASPVSVPPVNIQKPTINREKIIESETKKISQEAKIIYGGKGDDSEGYFIPPTIIETTNPSYKSMVEEIFAPVLTVYVYPENQFNEILDICDKTSPYALTGAIFSQDRYAIMHAFDKLRNAAGNFYINDKPTGAVVGQQPFGGGRGSGTNDKAGSMANLQRWISSRSGDLFLLY